MSSACPVGQNSDSGRDSGRTAFGSCMDAVRTLDPSRPVPVPSRPAAGGGLSTPIAVSSPSPSPAAREVWEILKRGLDSLDLNDHGRPWPDPKRSVLAELTAEHDRDLCIKAAWEARQIVQSQDRAPNVTGLFAKKLADLAEVRSVVRQSLAGSVRFVSDGRKG